MKTTKRLLSIVLALAMLLTMASFPAFADESYTYTPKDIVLEASINNNAGGNNMSEPRYIARPSDYNIFVGDKLVLPEGGLALKGEVKNNQNGVKPDAFVIDVFQDYSDALFNWAAADGNTRFYFAIDYTKGTYGTLTGIYPTMNDMIAGTNKLDGITLNASGLWGAGMIYTVSGGTMVKYASGTNYYNNVDNNGSHYLFSFEVQEAPTTADYQVSAPVASGITAVDIKSSITETAPSGTGNFMYVKMPAKEKVVGEDGKEHEQMYIKNVKLYQSSGAITGALVSFNLDFEAPAYVGTIALNTDYENFYRYEVYGSLDGNSWYPLNLAGDNGTGYNANKFVVNGIAKYFKIVIRDMKTAWGNLLKMSIKTATGKLNVFEGNTVTVTGDATATLTTDANGKVDMSAVLADCPAGEYLYYINGVDVTNKIADYVFTGATTVTVEKFVVPAGPVVTFKLGATEAKAEADPVTGLYEVPAAFKGNYSFYADANFKTKFDVTAPVNEDTTVYVKEFQWTHTSKTVYLELRDENVDFSTFANGPIVAPRETIYVGDTVVLPFEAYKDCIAAEYYNGEEKINDVVEITGADGYLYRYAMDSSDTHTGEDKYFWRVKDFSYTITEPGVYTYTFGSFCVKRADGTELYSARTGKWQTVQCAVFEVLPAPTSAPEAVVAPSYTGEAKEVTALLTDNFDTSVAFKKSYGQKPGYNVGGEGKSVVPVNKIMGQPDDGAQKHPINHTLYFQFKLDSLSYVDNITLTTTDGTNKSVGTIYDYDAYGSTDGENWYLLNSGITFENVYAVGGVAKYVRLVPRQTKWFSLQITNYAVNGYAVSANDTTTSANPTWLKDGEKVEITSVKELPVAYASGEKNYAITGWKVDTGAGLAEVSLAVIGERNFKSLGNLVPVVTEVPVKAASLTATLAPAGQDVVDGKTFSGKYINGFYVEGTQVRIPEGSGETLIAGGLRFVNILDNALIAELDALKTAGKVLSYEYGTLAMASTKYTGGDLVIGYNEFTKQVVGERIFASADEFEEKYFKYTVCVTGIGATNYSKDVMVRPYITINNADGTSVTLYGEQYQTSLYAAAELAAKDPSNSAEAIEYLNGILNK